jgi:hypothetical protein
MVKQVRTTVQEKGGSKLQSQAVQANQPENEAKLPAEPGAGERTHDRPMFVPRWTSTRQTGLVVAADLPGVKPGWKCLEKRVLSVYGRVDEEAPRWPVYRSTRSGTQATVHLSRFQHQWR